MPIPANPLTSKIGCPMDAILKLLMGQWTCYIIWVLRSNGPTRFGELKRKVTGISAKVLTERLRLLESSGVVHREFTESIPPKVTYSLTKRGGELELVLDGLNRLGRKWIEEDAANGNVEQIHLKEKCAD